MSAGPPSDDELAAIALALHAFVRNEATDAAPVLLSAWTLAMRRPDLEFDDLLALRNPCSIRF